MERNKLSVSQLNNYIKGVFDDELILKNITVFGEVSEKSEAASNLYMTLSDSGSILRCVRFGPGESPRIGETVLVTGSVNYYAKGNRVTFTVRDIRPYGEGELRRRFLLLKEKLRLEGLFDNRPQLPAFTKKVGFLTSDAGAVIHDFVSVVYRRHGYIDTLVYPVKVQGEGAAEEIAAALKLASSGDCDVIVVARGGGSNADLEVFNTELVARAVANCAQPVISAVGHETDYSLSDCCAGVRAGTPSIAAEIVCRVNERFLSGFYASAARLGDAVGRIYSKAASRTCLAAKRLTDRAHNVLFKTRLSVNKSVARMSNAVAAAFEREEKRCLGICAGLSQKVGVLVAEKESALKTGIAALDAASPLGIIGKGYSKVFTQGRLLTSVDNVAEGDAVRIFLSDGELTADITSIKKKKEG